MIGHNGKQFFGLLLKISDADNVRRCWIRRRRRKVGEQSTPNFRVMLEQVSLQKNRTQTSTKLDSYSISMVPMRDNTVKYNYSGTAGIEHQVADKLRARQ